MARRQSPGHRRFARLRGRPRTARRRHRGPPARGRRADRPERRRQDDARQRPHRLRLPDLGLGRARRRADHVVEPAPPRSRRPRADVPAQPVVRLAVRAGERRGGRARLGRGQPRGAADGRRRCSSCSASRPTRARPAATLAHGDERKLGVARALATAPRFVLMDEPAAGLPEAEVPDFAAVVSTVRDDYEAGVLLIDHNMALIMEVCDRIHVLDQGRTLAEGTPQEIRIEPGRHRRVPGRERGPRGGRMTTARTAVAARARARGPLGQLRLRAGGQASSTLTVGAGEIVGLIGPNGAGKSTTLHAIVGLVPARSGDIRVHGASIVGRKPETIARGGVALVPEGRRIFAELTVEENLRLGLVGARGRTRRRQRPRLDRGAVPGRAGVPRPGRPGRSRAASSSSSRSRGRSSRGRACCSSTSRRSGSLRRSWTSSSTRSLEIRARGVTVLLVEQRAQRTVALADRTYVMTNGEMQHDPHTRRRGRHRPDRRRLHGLVIHVQSLIDAIGVGAALRADRGRDRARVRRAPADQLRVRPADHARRLRARLHRQLARRGEHRSLRCSSPSPPRSCWSGWRSGRCGPPTPSTMLVATFAVAYLLQNAALLQYTYRQRGGLGDPVGTLAQLNQAVTIGSLHIRWVDVPRDRRGPRLPRRAGAPAQPHVDRPADARGRRSTSAPRGCSASRRTR